MVQASRNRRDERTKRNSASDHAGRRGQRARMRDSHAQEIIAAKPAWNWNSRRLLRGMGGAGANRPSADEQDGTADRWSHLAPTISDQAQPKVTLRSPDSGLEFGVGMVGTYTF
ncbi:unnamed protein product [Cutaneotrichosporon oleaginosum]